MNRHSVLLVEDEPLVRAYLKQALTVIGVTVVAYEDVSAAIDSLDKEIPSVVITDCNLPGESGTDLIRPIVDRRLMIPIIGISAEHYRGIEMMEAGAAVFLEKPIEVETLLEVETLHKVLMQVLGQ